MRARIDRERAQDATHEVFLKLIKESVEEPARMLLEI